MVLRFRSSYLSRSHVSPSLGKRSWILQWPPDVLNVSVLRRNTHFSLPPFPSSRDNEYWDCYNTHWMFLNVSILHRNTPTFSLMNIETATTITGCFSTGTYMSFFASQEITTLRQPPQNIGCKILIVWLHIYTLLDWISVSGQRKLYYVASLMCKLLRNNYPWPAWCHFAFCVCILWRIFLERSHFHATS